MKRFVAYYRVSTKRQGASGLGLEAQKQQVQDYLNGGQWELLEEFTEVESGRRNTRPELSKAIEFAQMMGATLVVAKLDRLSRDAAFLLKLRDDDVDFVCADLPDVNRMTVGVLALVAEYEAEQISKRTKAALAAAKARGKKLGTDNSAALRAAGKGNRDAVAKIKADADKQARRKATLVRQLLNDGKNAGQIAEHMNEIGVPTPRGGRWYDTSVRRLISRIEREADQ